MDRIAKNVFYLSRLLNGSWSEIRRVQLDEQQYQTALKLQDIGKILILKRENALEDKDMTLDQIRQSEKDVLTAADIADVMGSDPQTIRLSAKQHPELIGYPFAFHGSTMKIPRIGFINWFEGMRVKP